MPMPDKPCSLTVSQQPGDVSSRKGIPLAANDAAGEPTVCTSDDAYRCFMNTETDHLIPGSLVIERIAQPQQKLRAGLCRS